MATTNKIKDFSNAWKLPFVKDPEGLHVYVWDNAHNMCFNFLKDDQEEYDRVVDLLNGKSRKFFKIAICVDGQRILVSDDERAEPEKILLVRGWGHLTGTRALKLPREKAIELQTQLIEYTCGKLTGKTK